MMNYEMKSADTSSTHHYEVLKPIDSIKKKRKMNITPSRIENARGNVTLPLESPPEGGDLNRQRCNTSFTTGNIPEETLDCNTDFAKQNLVLNGDFVPVHLKSEAFLTKVNPHKILQNVVIEENTYHDVNAPNYCTVVKKVKKDNITPENIGEIILCQIPGISSVTAMAIMKKFKSFPHFLDEMKKSTEVLENLVCENNGKSRKISKACVENIKRFLLSDS